MASTRPPLAEALDLAPHPEGGWYRETWATSTRFHPDGYPAERASATAIHFLLEPDEESRWHRVRSDELWLWHRGGPLTLLLGGTGAHPETGQHPETGEHPEPQPRAVTLGAAVERGEVPQALVPGGTWQAARPAAGSGALVSCVVSPGFDFADFELW